jgi:hypothetical protein
VDIITTPLERVIHLALFVSAGIALGVGALFVFERVGGGEARRSIRLFHVAIPGAAFVALFIAERVYHLMH